MKIIENGQPIEGIPYPVAVWDAKHNFWDDSIVELSGVFANSEEEAIDLAKDYILEFVYELDDEEEREREKSSIIAMMEITPSTATATHCIYLYSRHTPTRAEPERLRYTRTTAKPCEPQKTRGRPCVSRTKTTTAATWPALSASMPYLFHTPT